MAAIFGVETKRINEAVKNNLAKFPDSYNFVLDEHEYKSLRSKISTSNSRRVGNRYPPKAFTEKGLYMLAAILKSKQAIEANFGIIEKYAQVREQQTTLTALHSDKQQNKNLIYRFSEL